MADDEAQLARDFPMRGIGASAGGDEFTKVRGTMGYLDEFGGWGKNLSHKPYELSDGRTKMQSKSEAASIAEALAIKEAHLCIHGELPHQCPHAPQGQLCRVRVGG